MIDSGFVWVQKNVWRVQSGRDMAGDTTTPEGAKAGLRGHDAGASGCPKLVDHGVKTGLLESLQNSQLVVSAQLLKTFGVVF